MKVINKNDAGREQEIQMEKPIRGKVPKSQAGAIEMSAMIVLLVVLILGAGAFFAWPNISYRLDKGSFNQQLSLIRKQQPTIRAVLVFTLALASQSCVTRTSLRGSCAPSELPRGVGSGLSQLTLIHPRWL